MTVQSYQFQSLEDMVTDNHGQVEDRFVFKRIASNKEDQNNLTLSDYEQAEDDGFKVDKCVYALSSVKEEVERDRREDINRRVELELNKIKDDAYKEGFEKGREEAFEEHKKELDAFLLEMNQSWESIQNTFLRNRKELIKSYHDLIFKQMQKLGFWLTRRELEKEEIVLSLIEHMLEQVDDETKVEINVSQKISDELLKLIKENSQIILKPFPQLEHNEVYLRHKDFEVKVNPQIIYSEVDKMYEVLEQKFSQIHSKSVDEDEQE